MLPATRLKSPVHVEYMSMPVNPQQNNYISIGKRSQDPFKRSGAGVGWVDRKDFLTLWKTAARYRNLFPWKKMAAGKVITLSGCRQDSVLESYLGG